jgi:hypothetical protein
MKNLFLITSLFLLQVEIVCQVQQQKKFYSVGFNAGLIGWAPATSQRMGGTGLGMRRTINGGVGVTNDLKQSARFTFVSNSSIGANVAYTAETKTKDRVTFQFEIQRNKLCYTFGIPSAFRYKERTLNQWIESDAYVSSLISVEYSWFTGNKKGKYKEGSYIKLLAGANGFHRNFGQRIKKNDEEDWTENGTGLKTLVVHSRNGSALYGGEIGKKFTHFSSDNSITVGVAYYHSSLNTYEKDYEFFANGALLARSRVNFRGSVVLLNLKYAFCFRSKRRLPDTLLSVPKEPVYELKNVNGRLVDVQEAVTIDADSVEVFIWDKNEMDNDVVTLYLNDQPVLINYTLLRTKNKLILPLNKGANYLVFHAVDLGKRPPVTTAVRVIKNGVPKNAMIISDYEKSGTWKIICRPRKK